MSDRNRNRKIEFGARASERYPAGGPPILVLRELGVRHFAYVMVFPGEPGYAEMEGLVKAGPQVGRGAPRVITTLGAVQGAWPATPLV